MLRDKGVPTEICTEIYAIWKEKSSKLVKSDYKDKKGRISTI